MLKENVDILKLADMGDDVEIKEIDPNEIEIILPFEGFTIKLFTPLFDIEASSPAIITLIGISSNEFKIRILTAGFRLETIIPSLVLEVFNPRGVRIIKIVAPPE